MSNQFLKLRRSNVPGRIPTTESLDYGEIALNTHDGVAYMKKSGSNGIEIIPIGSSTGSFSGNFTGTFTGSLYGTASWSINSSTSSYLNQLNQDISITGSLYQIGGTFFPNNIDWFSSSIQYDTGSYILTTTANGLTTYTNYQNLGSALSSYINTGSFSGTLNGTASWAENYNETDPVFTAVSGTFTNTSSFNSFTSSYNTGSFTGSFVGLLEGTSSWALNAITASYASNVPETASYALQALSSSYAESSSYAVSSSYATIASSINTLNQNVTISGSLVVTDSFTVLGSASITYISESTLNIGTNLITVNTINPGARFGGLAVIDSGSSPQISASFLYDSIKDEFVFVHHSIPITSSVFLQGPETYNDLGNEIYLTANRIPKGTGIEHIVDSNISDNGSVVSINSNTQITGSLIVSNGITGSFSGSGANLYDIPASGIVGLNLSQISSGSYSASISENGLLVNNRVVADSFSGSFSGSGANLFNIPASGIVGLNLSQIASGSVSASISPNGGLQVNTNVTATSFTGSLFGTASWSQNAVTSSYTLDAASQNTNFQQIFLLMGG